MALVGLIGVTVDALADDVDMPVREQIESVSFTLRTRHLRAAVGGTTSVCAGRSVRCWWFVQRCAGGRSCRRPRAAVRSVRRLARA